MEGRVVVIRAGTGGVLGTTRGSSAVRGTFAAEGPVTEADSVLISGRIDVEGLCAGRVDATASSSPELFPVCVHESMDSSLIPIEPNTCSCFAGCRTTTWPHSEKESHSDQTQEEKPQGHSMVDPSCRLGKVALD